MSKTSELFSEIFVESEGSLRKAVFSAKRRKSIEYDKVTVHPVKIGGTELLQFEYIYPKKVTHKNLTSLEAALNAEGLLKEDFKQVNIFTSNEEIQILASKPEKARITRKAIESEKKEKMPQTPVSHNRSKQYIIPDGIPCPFLIKLGVMGEDGKVFQRAYSKFRQINRYLEIVEDAYPALSVTEEGKPLKIIDFGCGKAYLTFALYHYLKVIKERDVEIIGLDLKTDVINFCNKVAQELGFDELKFLMGDIADYTSDHADMVVTLHACDTATDYALINAVSWNTKVILSVPCCQHELFKQINNDIHKPMLKHGILKDRLTEYLTDGLRALKLEATGYDVALIEFTSLEHTARNIMIKAVKSKPSLALNAKKKKAQAEYEALRDFYQVNPTIDKL